MASQAQRNARRRRRQRQRPSAPVSINARPVENGIRTVSLVEMHGPLSIAKGRQSIRVDFNSGTFSNNLPGYLSHAVHWRVRSMRVVFTSTLDLQSQEMLALYARPPATDFNPSSFFNALTRGGVAKLARTSGWSSNVLGAQELWVSTGTSGTGASIEVWLTAPANEEIHLGFITVHATIQTQGHK
uniref:Putative coat protein n=1 Tax=Rhizoctonia solani barnavirus 1 TaxID=1708382 RepID=A0A0M3SUM9_9VIRU|nr:putative coat protein [Rhizoctonia solani barnavirus 1]